MVGVVVSNRADHADSPYTTSVRHSSARHAPKAGHVHGSRCSRHTAILGEAGALNKLWGTVLSVTEHILGLSGLPGPATSLWSMTVESLSRGLPRPRIHPAIEGRSLPCLSRISSYPSTGPIRRQIVFYLVIAWMIDDKARPGPAAGQRENTEIASAPTGEHRLPILRSPHNRAVSYRDLYLSHNLKQ